MSSANEASLALALVVLFTLLFAPPSEPATKSIKSPVFAVLTGERYGGCMILLGTIPTNVLDCPQQWVSLDCKGVLGNRISGNNNLSVARTAMLTNSKLSVTVDDSRKISGFCYASQLIQYK
jgi:hypothetical protein